MNESKTKGPISQIQSDASTHDKKITVEEVTRNSELQSRNIINAGAATADELAKTRIFAEALERENKLLLERLKIERQTIALLQDLNETRKNETEALRATIFAKNETIAAKDLVIAAQENLMKTLKTKRTSPWKRIGDVLLGVAILAILK